MNDQVAVAFVLYLSTRGHCLLCSNFQLTRISGTIREKERDSFALVHIQSIHSFHAICTLIHREGALSPPLFFQFKVNLIAFSYPVTLLCLMSAFNMLCEQMARDINEFPWPSRIISWGDRLNGGE